MKRLQNFLYIFDLETGVHFLGILGIIAKSLHVLAAIQLTPILIQFVSSPLYFLTKVGGIPEQMVPKDLIGTQLSMSIFMIGMNFFIFGWLLIDVLLIRATISRNRIQLIPGLIVYTALCISNIIHGPFSGFLIASFIFFLFNFYALFTIFSLYDKYCVEESKEDRISITFPEFNANYPNVTSI